MFIFLLTQLIICVSVVMKKGETKKQKSKKKILYEQSSAVGWSALSAHITAPSRGTFPIVL